MAKKFQTAITGDMGENLARLLLGRVALVNPYHKDIGLDFYCELRDNRSMTFYVQAKASFTPHYSESSIDSLPIECKTVEQYWLQLPAPVFVFMSDTSTNKTYYTIANPETYQRRGGQKTYKFSIPLDNEITSENIGLFVADVARNQSKKSQQERELFLENHYSENPELYHDLDENGRFLEIMRGSDQHAQLETKMLLKQRFENGVQISPTIRDGLINIFINCKDVTTQIHTLDTLVYINERSVIPEVVKQINRNIRHYEYLAAGGRSHDIDFLFQGLVRFNAVEVVNDLNKFLSSKDTNILRSATRASGELKLKKTAPNLLKHIFHPDENVRLDASRALSLMMDKNIKYKLISILRKKAAQIQIDGVIRTLAETGDEKLAPIVYSFVTDQNSQVREAVVYCLGKIDPKTYIRLLVTMMNDDNLEVREQANRSVNDSIYRTKLESDMPQESTAGVFSSVEVEKIALPMLKEAYSKGRIPQADALLHFCKGDLSIPVLLEMYFDKKPHQKEFKYYDQNGRLYALQYIDLKVNVLEVLKKHPVPEVEADIIRRLESADSSLDVKYIIAAGELKLQGAFLPLSKLFLVKRQPNIGWIRSALFSIDPERAKSFALDVLKTEHSLNVILSCFEILHSFLMNRGKNQEIEDLINFIIVRLAQRKNVRADVRFQMWVKIFNVKEVISLFIQDIRAYKQDLRAYKIEASWNILEMMVKNIEGRDLLILELPSLDASLKMALLQWLGSIGDSQSLEAVKACVDDTDPDVGRTAKNIVEKSQKAN